MNGNNEYTEGIAVIGMSCRFPGAKNTEEFWRNLRQGVESVTFFTDGELEASGVDPGFINDPGYIKAGCVIEDVDMFDSQFFGYSPKEADSMDPQQRIFMECAWESFEDAGYVPQKYDGRIGVFGGMRASSYVWNLLPDYMRNGTSSGFQALLGTDKDYITNRISYKLNLKGPSITIQTACSTSLVAVHMACESLRSGECDMALAGGAALSIPQKQGYFYQEDMIFSPDGHCRAFDEDARGIIGGNGVGAVLLKPLDRALAEGDHIYAVIRGTAVNNDGQAKAGYTAPSVEGQAAVISEALAMAEVNAGDIAYIEAHGTGTPLGDPIEIQALTKVFGRDTDKKGFCAIGSVKTNIGHLDTAAGIASFIKTVLSLKHGLIPPSLNYSRPNPKIDFSQSPFFVNTSLSELPDNGKRCVAGVSSFGIGGTNAHVVVQQGPKGQDKSGMEDGPQLLLMSALTEKSLRALAEEYKRVLMGKPEASLGDIAYTMAVGRMHHSLRLALVCGSREEAVLQLEAFAAGEAASGLFEGRVQRQAGEKDETENEFNFTGIDRSGLEAMAGLYVQGVPVNWERFYENRGLGRVSLPVYCFDRKRHWRERPAGEKAQAKEGLPREFDSERLWKALVDLGCKQEAEGKSLPQASGYKEELGLLNRWLAYNIGRTLIELGAFEDFEERAGIESFLFQTPVMPRYSQYLMWLLEGLVREGFLQKDEDGYGGLTLISDEERSSLYKQLEGSGLFGKSTALLLSINDFCSGLGELLSSYEYTGNSSLSISEQLYRDYPPLKHFNGAVSGFVEVILKSIPGKSMLRVLEIGGGTGELACRLLPLLPEDRTEYTFTDVQELLLDYSREKLGGFPFVEFKVLDIQESLERQGFSKNQYDVVIAGNAMYAAGSAGQAATAVKDLLAPGGILLMSEVTAPDLLLTLLCSSWMGQAEDEELRQVSPFISDDGWTGILNDSGFGDIGLSGAAAWDGQHIFFARAPLSQGEEVPGAFAVTKGGAASEMVTLQGDGHPLLGVRYPTAMPVFEKKFKGGSFQKGYSVIDSAIAPVSLFYAMAESGAEKLLGGSSYKFTDFRMFDPLALTGGDYVQSSQTVQTVFTRYDSDCAELKIFSLSEEGMKDGPGTWSLNFSAGAALEDFDGACGEASGESRLSIDEEACRELVAEMRRGELYEFFNQKGVSYDTDFQPIEVLKKYNGFGIAEISLEAEKSDGGCNGLRAQAIEGCIQAAAAMAGDNSPGLKQPGGSFYFLTQVESIQFLHGSTGKRASVKVQPRDSEGKGGGPELDGWVYDEDGCLIGVVKGIHLAQFGADEVRRFIHRGEDVASQAGRRPSEAEAACREDLLDRFCRASDDEGKKIIQDYLIDVLSEILRLDKSELLLDEDFIQMGLDSLMFLELNQILARDAKVRVTAQEAFETPYISALAERIEKEIRARRNDEGENGRNDALDPVAAIGGIIKADIDNRYEPFDLTNVQYAYWIGRSGILDLGNVSCHFYFEVERPGLDTSMFNMAWNRVVERHDMLRSVILPEGRQRILPSVPYYRVAEMDFTQLGGKEIDKRLEEIRHIKSHQVISSEEWPLFDICVSFLPGRVRIHFSIELLNADVMSIQIIFSEVDAFMKNPEFKPKPLEISFRDYVLAEKALRETPFYQRSREYWIDQVSRMPAAPDLPLAKALTEVKNQRFRSLVRELDRKTWSSLKRKAAQKGVTPSGVLLAAYADVLAAWSRNSEFIISLAQFNRIPFHPDVFNITGDFTSIMIMAMNPSSGRSFLERAKKVQADMWSHLEHRHFDGVQVIRELARGKREGNEALIPVVFTSVLGMGEQSEELYPWAVLGEVGYFVSQTPQVWLDNQVSERNGQLIISWDIIEEVFPEGMPHDMLDVYENMLLRLAAEDEAWDEDARVTAPESHMEKYILANATDAPLSGELLHTLFLSQAKVRKEHPAVITRKGEISYSRLNTVSNCLAHRLKALGAEPNRLVAVVMEKGWEQVAAALGILMSGAAYLPISPGLPEERILHLLKDGQAAAVLTQPHLADKIGRPEGLDIIAVDAGESYNDELPPVEQVNSPSDIAYVIYTSGSTGAPKGVVIDHRGAVNTILDINGRFDVEPGDRVLALSAMNFDLSVYDIFGLLAAGGSIVMPEPQMAKDPEHWWELIASERVTVWNTVPVLMQMLMNCRRTLDGGLPESLRLVLMSGDWIPVELPGKIRSALPNAQVISMGGATEASIWSIIYPIERVDPDWKSIPYGKPMNNQHFYVLDNNLHHRPLWVPGQLYIGGEGLALGYWRDEEKTASSFVINPHTGERIYRTGDLGRYLPDGNIEFLGREDFQVKLRGYRIELGEIEAVLREHPGIKEAVVDAAGESTDEKRLLAYITCRDGQEASVLTSQAEAPDRVRNIWENMHSAGKAQSQVLPDRVIIENLPVFWEYMEELTVEVICSVLNDMRLFASDGEQHTPGELVSSWGILPEFERLIAQWLELLRKHGRLVRSGEAYTSPYRLPDGLLSDTLLSKVSCCPVLGEKARELLEYFRNTREAYVSLLKGDTNPLQLFISGNSMFTAKDMERFNLLEWYWSDIIEALVKRMLDTAGKEERLEIMELGTRANSMSDRIVPLLGSGKGRYTYTDSSAFFIDLQKESVGTCEAVGYKLFDFNKSPTVQDLKPCGFDAVIASNALHRASDIKKSLQYLKLLLKPGGLLIIYEGTRNNPLQLVTVGLFEGGFSNFEDSRRESCLPLLPEDEWRRQLAEAGFIRFGAYPEPNGELSVLGQSVIMAQAPERVLYFEQRAIQAYLKDKLPDYMVPGDIMLLESIPLTPNGKLDRKALPRPGARLYQGGTAAYEPPRSHMEKRVAEVWSRVLKTEKPGLNDDFLTSGGDSLQATQFVNMLRDTFKVDFPLRVLFDEATIASIARYIEDAELSCKELFANNDFEEGTL